MKHYKKRIAKIADELITYCFFMGSKDISLNIKEEKEFYKIYLRCNYPEGSQDKVEKLVKLLNCPKQEGIEEYYWELTGEGDVNNELSLIGMIIDKIEVKFQDNNYLQIDIFKYKK